jgi:hypothetical protein
VSTDDRAKLAEQQAALVDALAGRSPVPDGFDAQHVATAAASLLAKRRRGVEKTWPGLAASLGERFRTVFADYARHHPIPADGPAADGRLFASYLRGLGLLSDAGRVQLLLADMGRRPIAVAYLPARRALAIALRTFGGTRRFTVPLFRIRRPDFSQPLSPAAK